MEIWSQVSAANKFAAHFATFGAGFCGCKGNRLRWLQSSGTVNVAGYLWILCDYILKM